MKVFISGGTGSIGAHLVKMLSEKGYTIHVLARNMDKVKLLDFPGVVGFKGDILDAESVDKAMEGCDQAYHLAAMAKVWARNTGDFYDMNVQGTKNVLDAAMKHGVKRIVCTSTAGVLGPSISGEVTEDKVRNKDFFNEYEGSKAAAESKIKDYVIQHGLDVVIVSPTRVYGPFLFGESSSITLMIDKYINKSWRLYPGTGREVGNYVYIEDVALGHILAMEKGKKGHTYILGGNNYSFVEFFGMIRELSGVNVKLWVIPHWAQVLFGKIQVFKGKYLGGEPLITPKWLAKGKYNWVVDVSKAKNELGLPITDVKTGIQNTIDAIRARDGKK